MNLCELMLYSTRKDTFFLCGWCIIPISLKLKFEHTYLMSHSPQTGGQL